MISNPILIKFLGTYPSFFSKEQILELLLKFIEENGLSSEVQDFLLNNELNN